MARIQLYEAFLPGACYHDSPGSHDSGEIAHAEHPGLDDLCIETPHSKPLALRPADEFRRLDSEARRELLSAIVRRRRHFNGRGANPRPRAFGQVVEAQVEVDEDLSPGEGPARLLLRDEGDNPAVHDGELRIRVGRAVGRVVIPAR